MYQPPGQALPWPAIRRLFQPLGGENGVGAGSDVGIVQDHVLVNAAIQSFPSRRARRIGTVTPAVVVVVRHVAQAACARRLAAA